MQQINKLPYVKPKLGKDYWIKENTLPNAYEIWERCLSNSSWVLGFPWRNEMWPGMRSPEALLPEEIEVIENWVKKQTGAVKLWQEKAPDGGFLSHNFVQLVGEGESGPRPHTDSRRLCKYAGVLYLTPNAPAAGGTAFYRLRFPNGGLGGNTCPAPYANLREALGAAKLPLGAWKEDVVVPNVFNRLLVYRADLVHSATRYFGNDNRSKRMTVVFFWMSS